MSQLAGERLKDAISYNARRGLDPTTIEQVQKVVGVAVDGKLGAITAQGVFTWQGTVGLAQDGKIGPKTLAAIVEAREKQPQPAEPADPRLGVWVDDRARVVLSEQYLDNLVSLGLTTLAIMVHRSTAGSEVTWRPRWTADQLAQLRTLAEPRQLSLVITTWPLPRRDLLEAFRRELPPLLAASGAVGLEVDTEGNWLSPRLDGFADMDEAGRALVDTLREIAAPTGARLELTTYPFHPENGENAKVAPHMDLVFPQAYSVANRQDKKITWEEREGPGQLQRFSAARARSITRLEEGKPGIALGLPAYDQNFDGHSAIEALTLALNTACNIGVPEVRYWSSKWIIGHMRQDSPVDQFLLARANGRVARSAMPKRLIHATNPDIEAARLDGDDDFHQTTELEDLRMGMTPRPRPAPRPPVQSEPPPSTDPASDPASCPAS